jgi:signal transduction histidine kinase
VEEELKSAKETAEAASKYKSEFLNNVSHDLRTPMNAILGFSDVLRLAPLEEKYRKCAELMHEQSRYLLALVEDVLDTAMLESGKFKLKSEEFHLRALIEKVVETNRGTLAGKEVALSFEVKGEVVRFRGDPLRLRQIADNLLSNAIKYTDRGQIRVSLEIFPVETDVPVQWVSLSVRDTGFGIPAERLPHIYDPFTRLHEFYEGRTGGGVGLGLSIVKKLVQQMGGEIRVFSEVGKGTEFVVRLGLERVV